MITVSAELAADYETPLSAYRKIAGDDGDPAFLLESAEKTEHAGRYSFLGAAPRMTFVARGHEVTVAEGENSRTFTAEADPLSELENVMERFQPAAGQDLGFAPLHGGAIGYLAYDTVRYYEPTVPAAPPDALGLPDMFFLVADTMVVFDHRFRVMHIVANIISSEHASTDDAYEAAREKIDGVIAKLSQPLQVTPMPFGQTAAPEPEIASNTTKEEYCAMVAAAKEYIHAGDIFQVVPSQRFEVDYPGTPEDLYRALRHVNPSPYMFLLQCPGFALVGSSPEVHVRCIDSRVDIRPIAGTRWRGKTPEEDDALAAELLADPKEAAEHIMLVDLARNDVGRISEFASVEVTDFQTIERYSHVMHIVSNVHGTLAPGKTAYDVMRATFPAGTVSGSPKVRAMQIINELEKNKRCAYAGAVGYFGFDGNHDSCIALRTCVVKDGKAYVQAGAGVVADSIPENEHEECLNKARGMFRGIARAQSLSS